MKWIDVKTALPKNTNNVLVSNGYGSCAVAWLTSNGVWQASFDLITAENHDGGCHISIAADEIRFWSDIDIDSCPLPDWED